MVKIKLQNLDKSNCKLEYRELYNNLIKDGFSDQYKDKSGKKKLLPEGLYCIESFERSIGTVQRMAEKAIKKALKIYYSNWVNKYQILLTGATSIYSRNLDIVESEKTE